MEQAAQLAEGFKSAECMVKVTLQDGDETAFLVPEALLCNASAYFIKALNSGFRETKDRCLTLPGCSVEIFNLFLFWLCNKELPDFMAGKGEKVAKAGTVDEIEQSDTQEHLVRLWCFADAYLVKTLQKDAMCALIKLMGITRVRPGLIELTVEVTSHGSKIYEVLMQNLAYHCKEKTLSESEKDELGRIPGVLSDVVERFRNDTLSGGWTIR